MANPRNDVFTVFSFYCDSFKELDEVMTKEVGYKVEPRDVWSISIKNHDKIQLRFTLVIFY